MYINYIIRVGGNSPPREKGFIMRKFNRNDSEQRKNELLAAMDLEQLITAWESLTTTSKEDADKFMDESVVRGWIMDEIEKKAGREIYENWLFSEDPESGDDLRKFFL